ncbi:uncharacterized protein LOC121755738 [Salvia splendens]|uniref:uncharacterized protein LOC121754269 n=1 Tax=Salvia splendens TaxID=180675 RepID=UPI0011009B4C|nr:uncharacterized protein LOC121754269 [Salvia splendens]XP_042007041.1 uncharacterized protein LOC121755738 [Salvia splendens]
MAALSQANPSSISTASTHPTSPSNSPQSDLPKLEALIRESPDPPKPEERSPNEKFSDDSTKEGAGGDGGGEEEEEEEGECGFCLFMKAGGCRETFTDWEKCVEEGEKNKEDIVEKCVQATSALRKCMEAHSDYYAPLLDAEEAVMKQIEEEEKSDDSEKKEAP